jgi:hypothetical protein
MASTKILLVTGDELEVDATPDTVIKVLEDAARSSAGTLARLTQARTGEPIAVNAASVVAVRGGSVDDAQDQQQHEGGGQRDGERAGTSESV